MKRVAEGTEYSLKAGKEKKQTRINIAVAPPIVRTGAETTSSR